MVKVGIIGGSGLEDSNLMADGVKKNPNTRWGKPSSPLICSNICGVEAVILARHGIRHQIAPSQVNYPANIQALKDEGVTHIIATTACGSLRENIKRGDFVMLDQFIDFTRFRKNTFIESFEGGTVHPAMSRPFDEVLRGILIDSARKLGLPHHESGTVVTIEGPRFSTVAESRMFRLWGADVINMSIATECCLANEAAIPYAAVAMSTDYDCWKQDEEPVTWDDILKIFKKNSENVKGIIMDAVPRVE